MDREQFLDYLTRAVSEGFLTESEAIELLRKFDRGEVDGSMLPLPESDAIAPVDDESISRALIALAALGIIKKAADGFRFPRLSERQQEAAATRLQDGFGKAVRALAPTALTNLPKWHGSFSQTVSEHILQQAMMGRMRELLPSELATLDRVIEAQQRFALRFAEESSARLLTGDPFSVEYIGHRSELYSGEGRAEFYREKEAEEAEDGWVIDYLATDDDGTCDDCLQAESISPFLPGEGIFPGEQCQGKGFCRCTREARYSPEEYAELSNELAA